MRMAALSRSAIFPMAGGGWLSTHEDVTEKLRYEKALADLHAKALAAEREANKAHDAPRGAFDVVPEVLVLFDAQDRLVLWKPATARISTAATERESRLRCGRKLEDSLSQYRFERGIYIGSDWPRGGLVNERLAWARHVAVQAGGAADRGG